MNIEFKEVKGGFICVPKYFNEQFEKIESTDDFIHIPNNAAISHSQLSNETIKNVSRHGSVRKQQSLNQAFLGIPKTPNNIAHHARNASWIATPVSEHAASNNISQELLSAPIDGFYSPNNMLTTSKVQEMNMSDNDNNKVDVKEKSPIQF